MNLLNCSLVPAVVISADDPKRLGRVKCAAPGIFDPSTMKNETLPWVYPLCMNGYQSFSKLFKGSKIWLIENKDNFNEFWYIPLVEYIPETKKYLDENYDADPEVYLSRKNGDEIVQITYDKNNGIRNVIGKNKLQLYPDGNISIIGTEGSIDIKESKVYSGNKNENYEPAVLGNKLNDLLTDLSNSMAELSEISQSNPYTASLASGFIKASNILKKLDPLLAKNTFNN